MDSFLDRMAKSSRERAKAARSRESMAALLTRAGASPEPLRLELSGFDLIAELKLRSPALGGLVDQTFDPSRQLKSYAAGGAAAISVLTEPKEFKGELAHLRQADALLRPLACPVMRKDFLVDPYQVIEARANGASGVLLIAAMLSDTELDELLAAAEQHGLFVLLEAFDTDDLDRISRLSFRATESKTLIGINSRNLKTLAVDFDRFAQLADQIRDDLPAVAESGIESTDHIDTIVKLGFRLALVGSALMQDGDAEGMVTRMIAAGRRALQGQATCL